MQTVRCAAHPQEAAVVFCTTCDTHQTACPTCIIDNGKHHNHSFTSLENGLKSTLQHRSHLIDSIKIKQRNAEIFLSNRAASNKRMEESVQKCISNLDKTIDKLVHDLQKLRLTLHTAALRVAQTARDSAGREVNLDKVVKAARFASNWIGEVTKNLNQANLSDLPDLVDRTPWLNGTSAKLQEAMQVQVNNVDTHEMKLDDRLLSRFRDELGKLSDRVGSLRKLSNQLVLRRTTAINDKSNVLMVAGGLENNHAYVYDSASNTWRRAASLLEQRSGAAATFWNGKVVVAGGWNATNKTLSSVEQYDPESNRWSVLPKLQHGRYCLALVSFENTLFALGGWDGTKGLDSVERYNVKEEKWENATRLSFHRASDQMIQAASLQMGIIIVVGGIKTLPVRNACVKYDGLTKQWENIATLMSARENAAIAAFKDKLYIFGGEDERNRHLKSVEEYDSTADKWTLLPTELSVPRALLAAATVDGQIYLCGGLSNKGCDVVESFDASGSLVKCVAALPKDLRAAVAVSLPVSAQYFGLMS